MRIKDGLRPALAWLSALALAAALGGCSGAGKSPATDGLKIAKGKMLHLQQLLDRYDDNGNPLPQYLELWLTPDRGNCTELDSQGNALRVALDTGGAHLTYDPASHLALKGDESMVFAMDLATLQKTYPKLKASNEGQYAGRSCTFYLFENGNAGEWVKLYVDNETNAVLLCDAPLFRLRTALAEVIPLNESRFEEPADLDYGGGAGE